MAKSIAEDELKAIAAVVAAHPEGIAMQGILEELGTAMNSRALRYRLKRLVRDCRLTVEGSGRWTYYRSPDAGISQDKAPEEPKAEEYEEVPLSKEAAEIRKFVRKPLHARPIVGYLRPFLDSYIPNVTAYLSEAERTTLRKAGTQNSDNLPPGTLARHMLYALLIDLSWNSSRLEGNSYSLIETKRLIEFGIKAEDKNADDAQMILNHKAAIKYLVDSAETIRFDRRTILRLHGQLAMNLVRDSRAAGNLRRSSVIIGQSTFVPSGSPEIIEECFDQILAKAEEIENPYEQSLFVMAQIPYLQPFEDVNKRTSRLAANIPLFKANLTPISFTDVPIKAYSEAILGVYELNRIDLLKDVFIWACKRSSARYALVRDKTGKPDPFRIKHHLGLRGIIQNIVQGRMDRRSAFAYIADWSSQYIDDSDQEKFREMAEGEVLALHENNFPYYQIREADFDAWKDDWN